MQRLQAEQRKMFLVDGKESLLKSDEEEDLIFDHTSLLNKDARMKDLSHGCCPAGGKLQIARTINLCLSFFGLGLCFAIPTATLVDLQKAVNADENIKNIYTARYIGYLFGALIGGFLFDRYNRQFLLFLSLLATAIGILVMPFCQQIAALMACTAVTGITMGFLDTGGNVWCLDLWGRKSAPIMQTLHFCFGLGAFVAPIVAEPFLSPHAHVTHSIIIGNESYINGSHIYVPRVGLHHSLQSTRQMRHLTFYESVYDFEDDTLIARHKRAANESDWLSSSSNISYTEQMPTSDFNVFDDSTNSTETTAFNNSKAFDTDNMNSTNNLTTAIKHISTTTLATTTTKFKPKPAYADGNLLKVPDKWEDQIKHKDKQGNLVNSNEEKEAAAKLKTTTTVTAITTNATSLLPNSTFKPNNDSSTENDTLISKSNSTEEDLNETKNSTLVASSPLTVNPEDKASQNVDQDVVDANSTLQNITGTTQSLIYFPKSSVTKSSNISQETKQTSESFSQTTNVFNNVTNIPTTKPSTTTTTTTTTTAVAAAAKTTIDLFSSTTKPVPTTTITPTEIQVETTHFHETIPNKPKDQVKHNQNITKLSTTPELATSTVDNDNEFKSTAQEEADTQNFSRPLLLSKDSANQDAEDYSNSGKVVLPGSHETVDISTAFPSTERSQEKSHETKPHRINSDDYFGKGFNQAVTHFNSDPKNGDSHDPVDIKDSVVRPANLKSSNGGMNNPPDPERTYLKSTGPVDSVGENNGDNTPQQNEEPFLETENGNKPSVKTTSVGTESSLISDPTDSAAPTSTSIKPGSNDLFITFFEILHKNRLGKFEIPYILLAVYIFAIAMVFLIFLCKNPREPRSRQLEELSRSRDVSLSFKVIMVGLMSLFLCLYVGMEVGVGELLETFATKETLQLSPARGYFLPYLFWGSFAVARGVSIFIATRFTGRCMLLTNLLICIAASVLLVAGADKLEALLWVGVVMLGSGMAPLFPTSISWLEHYLHITNKTASSFVLGGAIGELIIPFVIDMFINQEPMVLMYVNIIVNALCFVSFIILCVMASKHSEKYQNKPRRSMYQLASTDDFEEGTELASNSNEHSSNGYHLPVKRKLQSQLT